MSDSPTFLRVVAGGALWVYAGYALNKLVVFLSTLLLARLLAVEDFGLVAYALIILNFADVLRDLGVSSALIAHPGSEVEERVRSTAFFLTAGSGALLTLVVLAAAPLAGAFFGEPRMVGLVQVLALSLFISCLGRTHDALLQKGLRFRHRLMPDVGQVAVKAVVSVTLAVLGFGAWSLVWGQVAGAVAATILSWAVFPWLPGWAFDRAAAGGLLRFGGQLVLVDLFAAVIVNTDYAVVGRILGTEALGLYTLAFRLPDIVLISLCYVLSRVLFPAFSRLREDTDALRAAYLSALRYTSLLVIPVGLGLAATAPALVATLFGPKWMSVIPVLQLLALHATVDSVFFNAGDIFKARGRGKVLLGAGLLTIVLLVPAMVGGVLWLGLPGAGLAWLLVGAASDAFKIAVLRGEIRVRVRELFGPVRVPLLAGAVMAAAVWLVGEALGQRNAVGLAVQVVVGVAVYGALVLVLAPDLARRTAGAVQRARQPGCRVP